MRKFVPSKDFKKLNVGFALDEGMASPTEEFALFNGERCIWREFFSLFYIVCYEIILSRTTININIKVSYKIYLLCN